MSRSTFLVLGSCFAAALPAQLTITDGNMAATTASLSSTSHLPRGFDLRADALALDHGFEHWWYYRVAGDSREYALRDVGGVTGGVTGSGTHADRDFADIDGRGLLRASLDLDVYSAGSASGVVISRLTVMNISNVPQTLNLFCYTDLDVAGSAGNDVCTGNGQSHFVTDSSGVGIEIRALGADASEVSAYGPLRANLGNTSITNLSNVLPPFSGDYTGAFQWVDRTLQPFEERTFQVVFAVDTTANVPPLVEHFGAGNGSQFQIHANELPLQDIAMPRAFSVRMKGALPNALHRIVVGVAPHNAAPFIPGLDLWVEPLSIIAVYGGFTDANGEASETFVIPTSAYLTGFSIYHQCFYVDAAAPNGFAFFTPGLHTRIGKL